MCLFSLLSPSLWFHNKISVTKNNRAWWLCHSICDTQWLLSASLWICFLIHPGEEALPGLDCLSELMRINNRSEESWGLSCGSRLSNSTAGAKVLLISSDCQLLRCKRTSDGQCHGCNTCHWSAVEIKCHYTVFNQQMHHTIQLLEHRAQENGVAHQDVQSSEILLPSLLNAMMWTLDLSILFTQALYSWAHS